MKISKITKAVLSISASLVAISLALASSPSQDFVRFNGQCIAIPEQVDCSVLQQVTCTFNGLPVYETLIGCITQDPSDIVKRRL